MTTLKRGTLTVLLRRLARYVCALLVAAPGGAALFGQHGHGSEGVGRAHMETSCAPAVQTRVDRALALLHNFWYARALTQFQDLEAWQHAMDLAELIVRAAALLPAEERFGREWRG